jgi:thiamine-phosphate pyrophosphorylase
MNDRCDLAVMGGAGGVHLGQDDLPVPAARRLLGPTAVVGLSTHDAKQVAAAVSLPVSYLAVGPVYDTGTKDTGYAAVGLEAVRRAQSVAGDTPVVAIGGITLDTAPDVVAAGAQCVAVISDLLVGGDPSRRVREYLDALGELR